MNYTVKAGFRSGHVTIPASKSYAHRQLICAALSDRNTEIFCDGFSKDILATAACLKAMGAGIDILKDTIRVTPIKIDSSGFMADEGGRSAAVLPVGESGSTLRFLLPVVAALGIPATFEMAEGLARRPVDELLKVMRAHGVTASTENCTVAISGRMTPGEFEIPGNVSSQYISGLLLAMPLLKGDSHLVITGNIESTAYINITEDTLQASGIRFTLKGQEYWVPGNQQYASDEQVRVERDWSNAAFFMCMGALSKGGITLEQMPLASRQGDKAILTILEQMGADISIIENNVTVRHKELRGVTVDAAAIPDLVPTIAALATMCEGTTTITNAHRLRLKESDRLKTTSDMLKALGAEVTELEDGLVIQGAKALAGGTVDACNDHRIAMAAAVAACGCRTDVVVLGAECVSKSYPDFWDHLNELEVSNE